MAINIEAVKDASKIEDIVGETHPLHGGKARYLRGQEHDSLVVDTHKQYYVWNSQGHSGDVITWLEQTRKWDFRQAVEWLCKRAGLPVDWDGKDGERYQAIRAKQDTLTLIARWLAGRLAGNSAATEWATSRGWSAETLEQAGCGFWDGDRKGLVGELRLHEIDIERPEVVAIIGYRGDVQAWAKRWNLHMDVNWVKTGQVAGMPSGMFVYPHYVGGRCVYLSGRSIEGKRHHNLPYELVGDKEPFFNHAYFHKADHVVVVEGQADALSLGQWGIPAIALAGLSNTPALVERLKAHPHVYVALDSDKAGKKAIGQIADLLGPVTKIVQWPKVTKEGKTTSVKDANDYLVSGGTGDECRFLLAESCIYAEWLARTAAAAEPLEQGAARQRAVQAMAALPDYVFVERKTGLARAMGLTVAQLTSMVKALQKDAARNAKTAVKTEMVQPNGFVEDTLFEMVFDPKHENGPRTGFAVRYPDGRMTIVPVVETDSYKILPYSPLEGFLRANIIRLPSKLEPYESDMALQQRVQGFIHKYVDLPDHMERLASYYVMMTWLFDVFYVVPYLRARGQSDSGKSRFTEVIGELCMRAMFVTGSTTPSPVFRTMDRWNGLTLIMDEADLPHSETSADWVQMFNTGYKRGFSILRTAMRDGQAEVEGFSAFGPKVINMRGKFVDDATESRCLTWDSASGRGVRADIPRYIIDREKYIGEALSIRNQLLSFRLKNYASVEIDYNMDATRDMPGRLIEITVPIMSITKEKTFKESVMTFVKDMNQQAIMQRSSTLEAKILEGILRAYYLPDEKILELPESLQEKLKLQIAHITRQTNKLINRENAEAGMQDEDNSKKQLYAGSVGKIINVALNLRTEKATVGTRPQCLVWDFERMNALIIRYGMEETLMELVTKANQLAEAKAQKQA